MASLIPAVPPADDEEDSILVSPQGKTLPEQSKTGESAPLLVYTHPLGQVTLHVLVVPKTAK